MGIEDKPVWVLEVLNYAAFAKAGFESALNCDRSLEGL
jgi:hypothetical protein